MNNMLTDLYRANPNEARAPTTQNEFPIDISSDEDDLEESGQKNGRQNFYAFLFSPSLSLSFFIKQLKSLISSSCIS